MTGSPRMILTWRAAHSVALALLVSAGASAQGHGAAPPPAANQHAAPPAHAPSPAQAPAHAPTKPAAKPPEASSAARKKGAAAELEAQKAAAFIELHAAVQQIRQKIGEGKAGAPKPPATAAASAHGHAGEAASVAKSPSSVVPSAVVPTGEGGASGPKPHASVAVSPRVRLVWRTAVIWPSELLEPGFPTRITLKWPGSDPDR